MKCGMLTRGKWRVSGGQQHPVPRRQEPSVPRMFGTSYMHVHSMRNNNQVFHGDQTRCEVNFYDNRPRMLVHDLFVFSFITVH